MVPDRQPSSDLQSVTGVHGCSEAEGADGLRLVFHLGLEITRSCHWNILKCNCLTDVKSIVYAVI
jgi:hypothetical protein